MKTAPLIACVLALAAAPALAWELNPQHELQEAQRLAREGQFDAALQKHIWFHQNALRIEPGMYGVRLSFALASWAELGDAYPKAREALVKIRDDNVEQVTADPRQRELFHDTVAIDRYLKEEAKTAELFKAVMAKDPEAGLALYPLAAEQLFDAKEWKLCAAMTGHPLEELARADEDRKRMLESAADLPGGDELKEYAEHAFVQSAARLVTILTVDGRVEEVAKVRAAALAIQDDAACRAALDQAEADGKAAR